MSLSLSCPCSLGTLVCFLLLKQLPLLVWNSPKDLGVHMCTSSKTKAVETKCFKASVFSKLHVCISYSDVFTFKDEAFNMCT